MYLFSVFYSSTLFIEKRSAIYAPTWRKSSLGKRAFVGVKQTFLTLVHWWHFFTQSAGSCVNVYCGCSKEFVRTWRPSRTFQRCPAWRGRRRARTAPPTPRRRTTLRTRCPTRPASGTPCSDLRYNRNYINLFTNTQIYTRNAYTVYSVPSWVKFKFLLFFFFSGSHYWADWPACWSRLAGWYSLEPWVDNPGWSLLRPCSASIHHMTNVKVCEFVWWFYEQNLQ